MKASMIRAYTSNVFAVGPSIWCAVATVVVAAGVLTASGVPVGVTLVVALVIAAMVALFVLMTVHVRVVATRDEVAYRVGFGRWRSFSSSAVRSSECVQVGAAAIVGIGIRPSWSTARHIVRAGPALHLEIETGENVWLSITSPLPEDLTEGPSSLIKESTHPQ
ncbi:hypothetical protein [Frigoribacterium sp. UYMn621]|uniref:hypothetical protein n=1 Tax=Frigoribacterium sp. UYMn621 TaxID=3156343 RepID=UPI0033964033